MRPVTAERKAFRSVVATASEKEVVETIAYINRRINYETARACPSDGALADLKAERDILRERLNELRRTT